MIHKLNNGRAWRTPDEGTKDADHGDHIALGRILHQAPQGVDAAEADRHLLASQVFRRSREAFGELALLGDAGLLVRRARLTMRAQCADRADNERAERDARQPQIAEDLAARGAVAAFLPVLKRENFLPEGPGEKPWRRQGRRDGTSGNQEKQDRKQHGLSGHVVNLSENPDGRQGAAGGAATPVQARRCWRGRAILEAA